MKDVCRALGVNITKSRPLCKLRKLAILGTGDRCGEIEIEKEMPF